MQTVAGKVFTATTGRHIVDTSRRIFRDKDNNRTTPDVDKHDDTRNLHVQEWGSEGITLVAVPATFGSNATWLHANLTRQEAWQLMDCLRQILLGTAAS